MKITGQPSETIFKYITLKCSLAINPFWLQFNLHIKYIFCRSNIYTAIWVFSPTVQDFILSHEYYRLGDILHINYISKKYSVKI